MSVATPGLTYERTLSLDAVGVEETAIGFVPNRVTRYLTMPAGDR